MALLKFCERVDGTTGNDGESEFHQLCSLLCDKNPYLYVQRLTVRVFLQSVKGRIHDYRWNVRVVKIFLHFENNHVRVITFQLVKEISNTSRIKDGLRGLATRPTDPVAVAFSEGGGILAQYFPYLCFSGCSHLRRRRLSNEGIIRRFATVPMGFLDHFLTSAALLEGWVQLQRRMALVIRRNMRIT